jgi:hypothetical protein
MSCGSDQSWACTHVDGSLENLEQIASFFFLNTGRVPKDPGTAFITQNMWQVQIAESPLHQLALKTNYLKIRAFKLQKTP